jgi:hypothetical protein
VPARWGRIWVLLQLWPARERQPDCARQVDPAILVAGSGATAAPVEWGNHG